jgi:transposase
LCNTLLPDRQRAVRNCNMTTSSRVTGKELAVRSIGRRGGVRPRRDFEAMRQRRLRAADLFEQGVSPAEIARQVGVSHQIVSDWRTVWRRYGRDGLYGAGRAGRRPKLSAEQLEQVEAALANGPEANGYTTDLWTLKRVAEVIERVSGVAYHPAHVWHLLRDQLKWTWQRPARRAVERNDEAIERWVKQRWPQIKKRHGARTR